MLWRAAPRNQVAWVYSAGGTDRATDPTLHQGEMEEMGRFARQGAEFGRPADARWSRAHHRLFYIYKTTKLTRDSAFCCLVVVSRSAVQRQRPAPAASLPASSACSR